jgi:predicted secreted protein
MFSLLNIVEIAELFYSKSYEQYGLGVSERLEIIEGRRLSRQVVEWILCNYRIDHETLQLPSIFWEYLGHQTQAITEAKAFVESQHLSGPRIAEQVDKLIFQHFNDVVKYWIHLPVRRNLTTFTYPCPESCRILRRVPRIERECFSVLSICC